MICLLQVCNFSLVSVKSLKRELFLFTGTEVSDGFALCLSGSGFLSYMLCIWPVVVFCVRCTVEALYKCPRPLRAPVQMPCSVYCFNGKRWSGGWRARGRTGKHKPLRDCWILLASQLCRISKHIIIVTFYIVCTDGWEINIGTRGLTRMLPSNIAGVENGVNKEFHYNLCLYLFSSLRTLTSGIALGRPDGASAQQNRENKPLSGWCCAAKCIINA